MFQKLTAVILILVLFGSCSKPEQFPEPVSEKLPLGEFTIIDSFYLAEPNSINSNAEIISDDLPDELIQMKKMYENKAADFNLSKMELLWNHVNLMKGLFSSAGIKSWVEATGFLFEVTGKEIYVATLEKIQYVPNYVQPNAEKENLQLLIEPYIFTRNNDFFHVNLFANASVEFEHSLFGHVKITQETTFPQSGDVKLKFNTEKKRFMEIYIRIPEWAEGASVTMQNVKYIAPPGDYCKIAKNWHEGDEVEIHFPIEKLPAYFKNN